MKTIPSFQIDHNILKKGIYISRIDDDITTYDIRMREPNREVVMTNAAMHTIEHIFATYVRNTEFGDNIIYFGPMGCRTGFYFLVRDMSQEDALELIKDTVFKCKNHTGEIPGNTAAECGNYKEHDFNGAIEALNKYYNKLKDLTVDNLKYN